MTSTRNKYNKKFQIHLQLLAGAKKMLKEKSNKNKKNFITHDDKIPVSIVPNYKLISL